jgi:DNA-binding MarR family transcriptional regulator
MANDEFSMGYLMHWAGRLLRRDADRRLKALGLSSGYLPVINALIHSEALSQKALIQTSSIEQSTMAATLARMERDGLVARRPDPRDRRSTLFSLTPTALDKVGAMKRAVEEVNQDALGSLPADQRQQFRDNLQTMILALEALMADDAGEAGERLAEGAKP